MNQDLDNTFADNRLWNANYIRVLAGNFLIYFAFMLLTPLLPLYLADVYDAGKDMIGLTMAGYAIAALVARMFSGYMVDSFPRKMVLLIAYSLVTFFFLGYMLSSTLIAFALFRTLHGAPFGATSVSLSTIAIDVLPSSRRSEGIGYYGLSNNVATAIAPSAALWLYHATQSYQLLFALSLFCSALGIIVCYRITLRPKFAQVVSQSTTTRMESRQWRLSTLDRFFLLPAWRLFLSMLGFAFSYAVLSTFVAIYGRDELGINEGTGLFFLLLAVGLIISRLTGSRSLRQGRVVENAGNGMLVSLVGYALFAAVHHPIGYYLAPFIIGLGNGHMWPAFQTMFINLAEHNQRGTANSTVLTSWDAGMGLGMLLGGVVTEFCGYHLAFWMGTAINLLSIILFFSLGRPHFLTHRLR